MHTSKKAGRPREEMKNFPPEQRIQMLNVIRELAALSCSKEDTAKVVGTSATTFRDRLKNDREMGAAWTLGRAVAKCSLRVKQFKLASRSAAMAIFLGKNYLGQKNEPGIQNYPSDNSVPLNLDNLDADELKQLKALLDKAARK
jgi:hypothetical protein